MKKRPKRNQSEDEPEDEPREETDWTIVDDADWDSIRREMEQQEKDIG